MTEEWDPRRTLSLVHVLITAGDEASAYRIFDALVDRFPGIDAPSPRPPARPGTVVLAVLAPTLDAVPAQRRRHPNGAVERP
ncbi:hypothetical protein SAMN05216267_10616 [Actinacidiphila rubida]|uniref:Uncharacterized protein n=1 Tax=Actinacidiphila rubida TaxID=310780 RepID=A0A1H8TZ56_9ACTN|nr:hypothetical protein [Actinacidiphila rubida]SEO96096.1 hypothetical protein SAMN05216267_10616 [Actinacidiphila rubida]